MQSGVRFDYIGLSGSYQLRRPILKYEERYQSTDCANFPLIFHVVSSNLLPNGVTFVMGVCKVLTDSVNSLTQRLMVRTLISLVHSLLIAGVISVRLDQQTEYMGFQGASDRKIKD